MHAWFYRIHDLLRPSRHGRDRNDQGFSFAQVIVTMVIVGILGGIGTFAAFQYIGQSRETVLAANIQTAAAAVQNTLALDPGLKSGIRTTGASPNINTGVPSAELISALSSASSGLTWIDTGKWEFDSIDDDGVVRIQMIMKASPHNDDDGCVAACSRTTYTTGDPRGSAGTGAGPPSIAPIVRWLVADGDAVRIQIKNADGAWACALIVLRPDWNDSMVSGSFTGSEAVTAEGNLRGIWYDAGANLRGDTTSHQEEANGRHNCSPTTVNPQALHAGSTPPNPYGFAATAADGHDPLPASGAEWNIPFTDTNDDAGVSGAVSTNDGAGNDILGRTLQRSVPAFDAT